MLTTAPSDPLRCHPVHLPTLSSYKFARAATRMSPLEAFSTHTPKMGARTLTPGFAGSPQDTPKNIVLCFDGTDMKFGPAPYTNPLKIFRMLDKDDPTEQICYYQPGIGASLTVESNTDWNLKDTFANAVDALTAYSLDKHIMDAYKFLMKFYCRGDKIYLFGFSRGAFTARVLSSMIERVGLLNPGLEELVESAWSIYSSWEYAAQPSQPDYTTTLVDEFKKTFTRSEPVGIEFMGLFDTVNSVGLLRDRMFPFTTRFNLVKQIRHAVSIDERRSKYKQNLIFPYSYTPHFFSLDCTPTPLRCSREDTQKVNTIDGTDQQTGNAEGTANCLSDARLLIGEIQQRLNAKIENNFHINGRHRSSVISSSLEYDKSKLLSGEFEERWFAGNHGDVGGGWAPSVHGQFLSCLPLRWILAEAVKAGLLFKKEDLVAFAERYSSLDSLLSPNHDLLSFVSHGLTLKISQAEKLNILKISNTLFNKHEVPYFRSCETNVSPTYEELFNSGVYSTSLKRLKLELNDNLSPRRVFEYYKDVPCSPVQGFDGRGSSSIIMPFAWWSIELLPLGTKIEDITGEWRNVYVPNLGRCRSLPYYAQLHWSVYWRLKYCYDYDPHNLPAYANQLWKGEEPTVHDQDEDEALLNKAIEEAKSKLKVWDDEQWRIVPDDLHDVLVDAGYYKGFNNSSDIAGCSRDLTRN